MTTLETGTGDIAGDAVFAELRRHVVEMTGLAYYLDKDAEFALDAGRRLEATGLSDWAGYLELLLDPRSGPAELEELTVSLTNGETFFFRHQELFDALREQVIPEMIARRRTEQRLRIWSAGCANGAEPYSLSILLQREFGAQLAGWDVTILGTDINRKFLAQGQRGEFGDWSLRSMDASLRAACFEPVGSHWKISDVYRRGVQFRCHNLVRDPFPVLADESTGFDSAGLDLILWRNVMIYFAPPIVRRLVGQFHDCLAEGGWLAVGPAEPNIGLFRAFETVNTAGAVCYRRRKRAAANRPIQQPQYDATPPREPKSGPRMLATDAHGKATVRAGGLRRPTSEPGRPRTATADPRVLSEVRLKLNSGQDEAAADCCLRLLAADPLNPLLHFYVALAAQHGGNHDDAQRALRRAIYLDRDFVLAHYHLGLVLLRQHDERGAGHAFRNVLAILRQRDEDERFPDADGLTVKALRQLAQMQLEVLKCT